MTFKYEQNRIYAQETSGKLLAEITFPQQDDIYDINHTFVDDSLRGQGIAAKLVSAAAEQIRSAGGKTHASCPYAEKWFTQHLEYHDILL